MDRRIETWGQGYNDDGSIPEPILRWQEAVHQPGDYDLDVDAGRFSPAECAEVIHRRLLSGEPGTAFQRLAISTPAS